MYELPQNFSSLKLLCYMVYILTFCICTYIHACGYINAKCTHYSCLYTYVCQISVDNITVKLHSYDLHLSLLRMCIFEFLVISHRKLQKLDTSGSNDGATGKSVFCFAATSNEKEQSHEKIMVCSNIIQVYVTKFAKRVLYTHPIFQL